ncbi:hypothetical protein [Deinococcus multiflagellatus]|uniref:Uncharacterized protein n=1 Tax=Deinococcus multiflagellatus TaxID=1656887 RepID=A0ABW1ZNZ4_9DEIO|nr:hypothetical protein [Deinococcus multiflagellatus]MBZ9715789.1 hypothetical protein [Deinococcus multiflagellatus]
MQMHISLKLDAQEAERGAPALLQQLEQVGVQNIDAKHLRRFHLISAAVPPEQLACVRALPAVLDVTPVGIVKAI